MTTIKLDIDRAVLGRQVFRRWGFVQHLMSLHCRAMYVARTKNGWHVAIQVSETLSPAQVVAVQAICGSDWRREAFCLNKTRKLHRCPRFWRDRWNVLYHSR